MSNENDELILFRLGRAEEALTVAKMTIEKGLWNTAVSELYYTCFYLISALLAKEKIDSTTHSGVKTLFILHFVKEGKVNSRWGKLINKLFEMRQSSDYGDFILFTEEEVLPLLNEVEEFDNTIRNLLTRNS